MTIKKKISLFFSFIVIVIFFYLLNHYKNDFHLYYVLKNIINGDYAYEDLKKNSFVVTEEENKYNSKNKDYEINWSFRPEHFHPIYPKLNLADIDNDGIKELYLSSQTKKIYEINGLNGSVKRTWQFPIGQSSSKGTLIYKKNNEFFLLTSSTISLPIRIYSLKLNEKKITIDWKANVHGQFVESGLNTSNNKIVVLTRDAPYSRGSVNIFNYYGKRTYGPEKTVDVCNARPIIKDDYFVHGSHNFYSAKLANSITKRNINSGKIIWSKKVNFDTGFITSNLLNFNSDNILDVVAYDTKRNKSIILDGKNGNMILETKGLILEKNKNNDFLIEIINIKNNKNLYKKNLQILEENNFFNYNIEKLITYLKSNNLISNFSTFYKGMLSKQFDVSKFFIKDLIVINEQNLKNNKKSNVIKFNEINFFAPNTAKGENYFILRNEDYSRFEFHIFYIYHNKLIYFVYDQYGKLIKDKIIQLHFDSFNNEFLKKFYSEGENPKFPNINIGKISDVDNDNKLEIILNIENYMVSLNLSNRLNINYDNEAYPNKFNDNFIFDY